MNPVRIPDIGSATAVIVEVPVRMGQLVSAGDVVVVIETNKATLEITAPVSGRVAWLEVEARDVREEGQLLVLIEAELAAVA